MANNLEQAKYHLKTSPGVSQEHYSHSSLFLVLVKVVVILPQFGHLLAAPFLMHTTRKLMEPNLYHLMVPGPFTSCCCLADAAEDYHSLAV